MTRKLYKIFTFVVGLCALNTSFGQKPNYTANDKIAPYTGYFAYGSNPGYFGGYNNNATSDKLMADLFKRLNLHTTRPALYDAFLEQWGLNIRVSEFEYYTKTLGMHDLTLFLNEASESHRETVKINCGSFEARSLMFKNMYEPIWDDSTNGKTPINDQNYFAAYIYKVVKTYGKYVKFYEIWNEPDYVHNGNIPLLTKGQPGNWWENNPAPCDLINLNAPVTNYIRLMRIAYEVIKSQDPNALVTTGGIGYDNFLDVILRNTDAPDGKVSAEYPLKGGAYFDVISFHSYPQYTLSAWDNSCSCRKYLRHSDNAANKVIVLKDKFEAVLKKYGYDGITYPKKYAILTETNIPGKSNVGKDHIGSAEAQRNFAIKMFVLTQKNDIKQSYIYTIGDGVDASAYDANKEGFDMMGLYYNLNKATPATATPKDAGIAVKSLAGFLHGYAYDATATAALKLPNTVDGGAFVKGSETRYVLWAKTNADLVESPSGVLYSFPLSLGVQSIVSRSWNFASTNITQNIAGSVVGLVGSPQLITVSNLVSVSDEQLQASAFTLYPNPAMKEFNITFAENTHKEAKLSIFDMQGIELKTAILAANQNTISAEGLKPGVYQVKVFTDNGSTSQKLIIVE